MAGPVSHAPDLTSLRTVLIPGTRRVSFKQASVVNSSSILQTQFAFAHLHTAFSP